MTDAGTIEREKRPREKRRGGLFITDEELIERLQVPEKIARQAIAGLDKDPKRSGFPQKQALWGGRRYWPAVRRYLDKMNGLTMEVSHGR